MIMTKQDKLLQIEMKTLELEQKKRLYLNAIKQEQYYRNQKAVYEAEIKDIEEKLARLKRGI